MLERAELDPPSAMVSGAFSIIASQFPDPKGSGISTTAVTLTLLPTISLL